MSVKRNRSLSELMLQWLGETDASSRQIEFEESRPMDRNPATRNSDFRSGPLSAASLGCTVSDFLPIFSPGKPTQVKGSILTPTLSRRHWKKSRRMDSATIQMVRFSPGGLLCPACSGETSPYLLGFQSIARKYDSLKTHCNDAGRGEYRGPRPTLQSSWIATDSDNTDAPPKFSKPGVLPSPFNATSSILAA